MHVLEVVIWYGVYFVPNDNEIMAVPVYVVQMPPCIMHNYTYNTRMPICVL